jgi:ubiquinone biosynthesis protein UbiJ
VEGMLFMDTNDKIAQVLEDLLSKQNQTISMLEDLSKRVTKIEINQENTVLPQMQLLSEGQTTIQGQIRKLSIIDSMQDDISTLKSAVRYLSEKVQKLENAM